MLELEVGAEELHRRSAELAARSEPNGRGARRGYVGLYQRHVLQAPLGRDFDFLRLDAGAADDDRPEGLFDDWLSGW